MSAPSGSTVREQAVDFFLTSSSPSSVLARTVAVAAVAGGLTYYATANANTRKQSKSSDKGKATSDDSDTRPPAPPPKDKKKRDDDITRNAPQQQRSQAVSFDDDVGKRVRFESLDKDEILKPIPVAVFWDVDNCSPPTGSSGREIISSIRKHLASINTGTGPDRENLGPSGPLMSFKAYLELSSAEGVSAQQVQLRSELQGSGVSLIDTPKSGRKDVADKMIIADIMAYALDVPPPARIVLLSGDRDFAYPLSLIRGRGYQVVLITPPVGAVPILKASANHVARWRQDVLGMDRDGFGRPYEFGGSGTPSKRSSSPGPYNRSASPGPYNRSTSPGPSGRTTPTNGHRAASTSSQAAPAAPEMKSTSSLSGPGAGPVPTVFAPLVQALEECKAEGLPRPLRSKVAVRLTAIDKDVYEKAGATAWRDYIAVAEAAGIVVLGSQGKTGTEWVALRTLSAPTNDNNGINGDGFSVKPMGFAATSAAFVPNAGTKANAEATKTNTEANAFSTPVTTTTMTTRNSDAFSGEGAMTELAASQIPESTYATVRTDDTTLPPPAPFIPLLRAVHAAEQITQRSPPVTSFVGRVLELMIESGRVENPYDGRLETFGTQVKRYGTYITAAYKARVAKLTPTEKPDVPALQVSPAYSNWLQALASSSSSSSDGPSPPSPSLKKATAAARPVSPEKREVFTASTPSKAASSGSLNKTPIKVSAGKAPAFTPKAGTASGSSGTPGSSKKSLYLDDTRIMSHKPSQVPIPLRFFPLANALLFSRSDGRFYMTDKALHSVIAKHKSVGLQYKSSEAFSHYLREAEQAGVLGLEKGNKEGVLHVRLADRLRDPKEKNSKGGEGGEKLPVAGANPYDTSSDEITAGSSSADGESNGWESDPSNNSPVLRHGKAAAFMKGNDKTSTSSSRSTPKLEPIATPPPGSTPTLEDRKRFKPLMDALLALRREENLVYVDLQRVTDKMGNKIPSTTGDSETWISATGCANLGSYLISARNLGFVTAQAKDGARASAGGEAIVLRLGERYERKQNE